MKKRIPVVIRRVLMATALCCVATQFLGQTPNEPGVHASQLTPKRQGFFDYALGQVNPHDTDYGSRMVAARNAVVGYTIDDLYFWSNVATLLLLCGLAAIVLFQWRAMNKRELIAASLIAQLWDGRVSDRVEIERRTEQFNRLVEAHNAEAEAALSRKTGTSDQESGTNGRSVRALADGKGISPAEAEKIAAAAPDATAASLQQSTLLLQRRVEALQNSEQNLKQRLNQTTVLLDQERRRNATLKGA
ncbi:hypothetical protein ACFPT7_05345 [Acidicapsa dinghuensis]|uniref:Uncharacterized protein n=1 Tax=Acidicapsa dinghuensis TaxID=2218256 RepID=A0ABW1ECA0_9BACT|nr:hypothetical protein [Acidicapsa dinghuensis]